MRNIFDFWTDCHEFKDAKINKELSQFASSSINFGFPLKFRRIKD